MRCLVDWLEQRDALGSSNEYSDAVWFQTHYKPFAGAKSARSPIEEKERQVCQKKSHEVPAPAAPEPEYAAFVALDWADQKHDWQLVAAGSQEREKGEFDNTPEAVMAWVANLSERFGSRRSR